MLEPLIKVFRTGLKSRIISFSASFSLLISELPIIRQMIASMSAYMKPGFSWWALSTFFKIQSWSWVVEILSSFSCLFSSLLMASRGTRKVKFISSRSFPSCSSLLKFWGNWSINLMLDSENIDRARSSLSLAIFCRMEKNKGWTEPPSVISPSSAKLDLFEVRHQVDRSTMPCDTSSACPCVWMIRARLSLQWTWVIISSATSWSVSWKARWRFDSSNLITFFNMWMRALFTIIFGIEPSFQTVNASLVESVSTSLARTSSIRVNTSSRVGPLALLLPLSPPFLEI